METRKNLIINSFLTFTLLYIGSVLTNGILGPLYMWLGYYPLILIIPILLLVFVKEFGWSFIFNKENVIVGIFVILSFLPFILIRDPYFFYLSMELGIFAVIYNIFLFCKNYNNEKTNKTIAYIILVNFLLTFGGSIVYSLKYGNLIRIGAFSSKIAIKENYGLKTTFLLGTYATSCVSPIILFLSIKKIINKKYHWVFVLVLSFIFLILSDFFILTISCILCVIIYFSLHLIEKINIKTAVIGFLISIVCLLLIICVLYSNNLLPTFFTSKINYIITTFSGNFSIKELSIKVDSWIENGASRIPGNNGFEQRIAVYMAPLMGIIKNKFLYIPSKAIIGSHSSLLDSISIFGILSIALFYWFDNSFKNIKKSVIDNKLFLVITIYFIMVCTFDASLTVDNALALYIVIPFSIDK